MTSVEAWNPMILYEGLAGGNLLQKENLLIIENIENEIKGYENWPNVCLAASVDDESCASESFLSPLMFLQLAGVTKDLADMT